MFPADIDKLARQVLDRARAAGLTLATVESCTGGLMAGALTAVAGSSDVVDRGFVTYSNEAKTALVGVPPGLIETFGAVSAPVAVAMAEGGVRLGGVGAAVSITGIAGPGGGSDKKPVGLVYFAVARSGRETIQREKRFGDIGRNEVRMASVKLALTMLAEALT